MRCQTCHPQIDIVQWPLDDVGWYQLDASNGRKTWECHFETWKHISNGVLQGTLQYKACLVFDYIVRAKVAFNLLPKHFRNKIDSRVSYKDLIAFLNICKDECKSIW